VAAAGFYRSLAALGSSPAVSLVVDAMIDQIGLRGDEAPVIPGTSARVIKTTSYGDVPALRLVYRVHNDVIFLYDLAVYDELKAGVANHDLSRNSS
jgi:hypothetical protein